MLCSILLCKSLFLLTCLPRMETFRPFNQCFSTFWASSPGKRKIFKPLSRSKKFVNYLYIFQYSKTPNKYRFCINFSPKYCLMIKIYNWRLIQGEICTFRSIKLFQVPAKRSPSPGAGTRPGGWESLLLITPFWRKIQYMHSSIHQ